MRIGQCRKVKTMKTNPPIGSQHCDRHSSAWAKAMVILPSLGTLYFCGHCINGFERDYQGEFHVDYETVTV